MDEFSRQPEALCDNAPTAIIFIGIQASGKTTFYEKNYSRYEHINMDTLHTRNKERIALETCIAGKRSFVADNTNPTKEDRRRYMIPAKAAGYKIIGFFFQSIVSKSVKRNEKRGGMVPNKVIACTSNKLELPEYEEGFDELYFVSIDGEGFRVERYIVP